MDGLTSLTQAQEIVLDAATPLGCEKVGLLDTLGRVLGEDIVAPRDNPPWNNSAMDGFAVRWEDIRKEHEITKPAELTIVEDVQAGQIATKSVGPGEAIRIMTGAPVPEGADTVVRVEFTEPSATHVRIFQTGTPGCQYSSKGRRRQGRRMHHSQRHPIASGGNRHARDFGRNRSVLVHQRPRVAILSTGDELADLDEKFDENKIVNSNSYGIAAAVQEAGGMPLLLGIARDTPESLKEKISQGLGL